ncbi:hypothetical protein HPS57_07150 [Prevotella sp. PINT]|jgi:hypothetical protein|uniref:hypothetical protein n=1 Tax=Palleniella intestinalis TaxID=2736291 RepID=UPI00155736E9|nr:hypothetical protein [Palleniella intestinalis]NPD81749.1 hypothetical protein [Palleniella intestinalis]
MTEYILRVEDNDVLSTLRKLISWLPGVTLTPVKKSEKNGLDEALEDVAAGRVTTYKSVDEMFENLGIKA